LGRASRVATRTKGMFGLKMGEKEKGKCINWQVLNIYEN
jgi:hypothetical protein